MKNSRIVLCLLLLLPLGCVTASRSPIPGAGNADDLIEPGEVHFKHLWQVTEGGENAEAYWSFDGNRLVLQRRNEDEGVNWDRIYVMDQAFNLEQVSPGKGVTTCSYFLPGDRRVVFASTHGYMEEGPPPVDHSEGYVWALYPEYDVWVRDLDADSLPPIASGWGYDAEATVSPVGDRIVFTSTRSGDLELWTCDLDGASLFQVTDELGYDGGAFFSHDGEQLVFRTTAFTPGQEAEEVRQYQELLGQWRIRPHSMEIMLIDVDGTNRRQLTHLGGANFAPFFHPDDSRVVFSTNHHESGGRNFDLYSISVDTEDLERITTYSGFDSFPMFSPDGRYLAFASNRGGTKQGETNVFIAEWQ